MIVRKPRNWINSNCFLTDKKLSMDAKGMLAVLMTMKPNTFFTNNYIYRISRDSKKHIDKILDELVLNKYLIIDKTGEEFTVYNSPHCKDIN